MNSKLIFNATFIVMLGFLNIYGNIEMKNVKVSDDIELYFTFKDGRKYVCNYTVLLDGKEALIIDSGYKEEALFVMEDLLKKGITPVKLILSHPHEDHVNGYEVFGDVKIMAGEFYKEELDTRYENIARLEVDQILMEGDSFSFGNHELSFMYTPGHAKCSITTIIDSKYLHVGDLVFRTEDGLLSVPYLGENNQNYLESLERIKSRKPEKLFLGHGEPFSGNEDIQDAIDNLIFYIEKFEEGDSDISLQDCLKEDVSNYGFHSLHETNIKTHKTK